MDMSGDTSGTANAGQCSNVEAEGKAEPDSGSSAQTSKASAGDVVDTNDSVYSCGNAQASASGSAKRRKIERTHIKQPKTFPIKMTIPEQEQRFHKLKERLLKTYGHKNKRIDKLFESDCKRTKVFYNIFYVHDQGEPQNVTCTVRLCGSVDVAWGHGPTKGKAKDAAYKNAIEKFGQPYFKIVARDGDPENRTMEVSDEPLHDHVPENQPVKVAEQPFQVADQPFHVGDTDKQANAPQGLGTWLGPDDLKALYQAPVQ